MLTEKQYNKRLAQYLKALLKENGVSRYKLDELIGLGRMGASYRWVKGQHHPNGYSLYKLYKLLGFNFADLEKDL